MTEMTMGMLPTIVGDSERVDCLQEKLIDVEILYILTSKPTNISELKNNLNSTFGLKVDISALSEKLAELESEKLVRWFQLQPTGSKSALNGLVEKSFSVTPKGLITLQGWIESLSEITLTLQLGLNQRVIRELEE
ncbi:MAG: hypothetical protein OK439_00560 [Thaumarchaeota archaeon]|nr:hypothetical protein [Nitrososphaerota archaeon]